MNNLDLSLEIDRKKEYTKQVVSLLNIRIYEGIHSIYKDAKKICRINGRNNYLEKFQKLLSTIPKWNKDIIEKEFIRIKIKSECSWLEELITAVFVSHTKVLTAIKGTSNFDLEIPSASSFIHKCYIECARIFWKNPYLFSDEDISPCEYQRNLRDCENIISKTITETIRKSLPVENILRKYLGNSYKQNQNKDNDDTYSIVNVIHNERENLKNLVKLDTKEVFKNVNNDVKKSYDNLLNENDSSVIVESLGSKDIDKNNFDRQALKEDIKLSESESNFPQTKIRRMPKMHVENHLPLPIQQPSQTFQNIHTNQPNQINNEMNTQTNTQMNTQMNTQINTQMNNEIEKQHSPQLEKQITEPENVTKTSSKTPSEIVQNIDQFVESLKKQNNTNSTNKELNSINMSYSTTLNSKINNLDAISENTHSGTRIKKTEQTVKILQNSEKDRKNRRKFNRYLFRK